MCPERAPRLQHMQLVDAFPLGTGLGGEVLYAGGVKADGSWGGNSLFNNKA